MNTTHAKSRAVSHLTHQPAPTLGRAIARLNAADAKFTLKGAEIIRYVLVAGVRHQGGGQVFRRPTKRATRGRVTALIIPRS